jgi:hypothetical protein
MKDEKVMKRFGVFYCPLELIETDNSKYRVIMSRMRFIGSAQIQRDISMVEYACESSLFDPIPQNETFPEYIVGIRSDGSVFAERGECVKKPLTTKDIKKEE